MHPAKPSNVFLVGPMGVGKSTVGRHLAKRLGWSFFDSDQVIEQRTGVDISQIFDIEGEVGFRKREAAVIDELSQMNKVVLATGGGAVVEPANRQHLATRGTVIFLQSPFEQQFERVRHAKNRPLLQVENPAKALAKLTKQRETLYLEIADRVVNTGQLNSEQVADQIQQQLKTLKPPSDAPFPSP